MACNGSRTDGEDTCCSDERRRTCCCVTANRAAGDSSNLNGSNTSSAKPHRSREVLREKLDQRLADVVAHYRSVAAVPIPIWTDLSVCPGHVTVRSRWRSTDMDLGQGVTVDMAHRAEIAGHEGETMSPAAFACVQSATVVNETMLARGSHGTCAIHKRISKGDKKLDVVEFWNESKRLWIYEASGSRLHGKMIVKGVFAAAEWSKNESKFLFVAERTHPQGESFFCRKPAAESDVGAKYRYEEDWGEGHEGIFSPVIVVLDPPKQPSGDFKVQIVDMEEFSLGPAIFTPDEKGVIFTGVPNSPYRLGIYYIENRVRRLFHHELATGLCSNLGDRNKYIFSPRFTATGRHLLYLQNDVGGPNQKAAQLVRMGWPAKIASTIVTIQEDPKPHEFPGLYSVHLLRDCTSPCGNLLYVASGWRTAKHILQIDLRTGRVINLTQTQPVDPSHATVHWELLGVNGDYLLASRSWPHIGPNLLVGRRNSSTNEIRWTCVESKQEPAIVGDSPVDNRLESIPAPTCFPMKTAPHFVLEVLELRPDQPPFYDFQAIYIYPKATRHSLIVIPHGGPHVAFSGIWNPQRAFFLRSGYGLLLVNYRGSLNYGESFVRSLSGHIGDVDVKDVQTAVIHVKQRELVDHVVVFCGSYGGFVGAHLIGQYPSTYAACCLMNPIIDLTMLGPSDISDWFWYEGGCEGTFRHDSLPTDEDLAKLRACSPIAHAHKIATPTLLCLGSQDVRMDKAQGLRLYRHLLARGVETCCNMYNDNHFVTNPAHRGDLYVSCVRWFDRHCAGEILITDNSKS